MRGLGPGGSFMLRTFPARHPPLWADSYVARVRVSDLEADRNFLALVVRLRQLGDDPAVAGVLLDIEEPDLGLGRIEELRALVADLRQRKPVLARLTQPDTRANYLASACDRVFIDPAVGLTFGGFAQTVTFYKTALDRLGVEVDLVRIAEYKGAMEPFVMNGQSSPVAANRNAILDEFRPARWPAWPTGVRRSGLDQAKLRGLVDRAVFSSARSARGRAGGHGRGRGRAEGGGGASPGPAARRRFAATRGRAAGVPPGLRWSWWTEP